ncbi:MAG: hypothetical protein AAGH78_01200 [Cyanobacteria bacterium P01_H01_bin.58]
MSEFSSAHTKVSTPDSDFTPASHQLPGQRAFVLPPKSTILQRSPTQLDLVRMQQLDAAVMKTLPLQAKQTIETAKNPPEQQTNQPVEPRINRISTFPSRKNVVQCVRIKDLKGKREIKFDHFLRILDISARDNGHSLQDEYQKRIHEGAEYKLDAQEEKALNEVFEKETNAAVRDVMKTVNKRAERQYKDKPHQVPANVIKYLKEEVEVLHATDPTKLIDKKRGISVGDSIAKSKHIKNIHQTQMSMFGNDTDSSKRIIAELGTFYPQKYKNKDFKRQENPQDKSSSQETSALPKGVKIAPPKQALPKYGALNLYGSQFGAIAVGDMAEIFPLHFAIKPNVKNTKVTLTSSDSLKLWSGPFSELLEKQGFINEEQPLPSDDKPWGTGPVATFSSPNLGQVIAGHSTSLESHLQDRKEGIEKEPPSDYVEAQIHGPIRIDRDISHAYVNFFKCFGNPRFKKLYDELIKSNIDIVWYFKTGHEKKPKQLRQSSNRISKELRNRIENGWGKAAPLWKDFYKRNPEKTSQSRKTQKSRYNLAKTLHKVWGDVMASNSKILNVSERSDAKDEKKEKSSPSSQFEKSGEKSQSRKILNIEDEHEALELLHQNNCLINAISRTTLGRKASELELISIRIDLGSVGEMLLATPETLKVILRILGLSGRGVQVKYDHLKNTSHEKDVVIQGDSPIKIRHDGENHFYHDGENDFYQVESIGKN